VSRWPQTRTARRTTGPRTDGALQYVFTSTVTVAAGTAATPTAGEPATGGAAGWGNAATAAGQGGGLWPQTFLEGTTILLDPAGATYAAIGAGNLRAYVQGMDDVGHAALST
jgi:hypothetical protein